MYDTSHLRYRVRQGACHLMWTSANTLYLLAYICTCMDMCMYMSAYVIMCYTLMLCTYLKSDRLFDVCQRTCTCTCAGVHLCYASRSK